MAPPTSEAAAFRKLEHREHVLLRPEMYIGSVTTEPVSAWVVEGGRGMQRRDDVAYCPGLLKVFDEIVVNAIDHSTRSRQAVAHVAEEDPM